MSEEGHRIGAGVDGGRVIVKGLGPGKPWILYVSSACWRTHADRCHLQNRSLFCLHHPAADHPKVMFVFSSGTTTFYFQTERSAFHSRIDIRRFRDAHCSISALATKVVSIRDSVASSE